MFEQLAEKASRFAGRPAMVILCLILSTNGAIAFASGSEMYLNGSNILISVVTLLLLPVLQASQNRDGAAVQAKLDELIKATPMARDALIRLEDEKTAEIERDRIGEARSQ